MDTIQNTPIDRTRSVRRIAIRCPRSRDSRRPRMFDILVAGKDIYLEFRTENSGSEIMHANEFIRMIRQAANTIEHTKPG